MITINGINIVGVPCGTRCSNMWLVFLIHPNNMNLIHKGRARVSVLLAHQHTQQFNLTQLMLIAIQQIMF
jgi:hypothetical protein